jgi:hypothetical protein
MQMQFVGKLHSTSSSALQPFVHGMGQLFSEAVLHDMRYKSFCCVHAAIAARPASTTIKTGRSGSGSGSVRCVATSSSESSSYSKSAFVVLGVHPWQRLATASSISTKLLAFQNAVMCCMCNPENPQLADACPNILKD